MIYILQKLNVAYTRCMRATEFNRQAIRIIQEINTSEREQEDFYISLKIYQLQKYEILEELKATIAKSKANH